MSIRTQLDNIVSANAALTDGPGDVVPARALTARKAGAGPTSALGVESSAVTSAGALVVTATNGLVVPPVYLGLISAALTRSTALPITKSGTTYIVTEDPTAILALILPLAASSAGFKAKILLSFVPTVAIQVYTATVAVTTPRTNTFVSPITTIRTAGGSVVTDSTRLSWAATGLVGDYLEFECDGRNWHVTGFTASTLTFAAAT